MAAFIFGNVHGSYKPGYVKLRPGLPGKIQSDPESDQQGVLYPNLQRLLTGSCSSRVLWRLRVAPAAEIAEAAPYGQGKMNVDTDTQYAYSRAIAGHMFSNYDKVLKN